MSWQRLSHFKKENETEISTLFKSDATKMLEANPQFVMYEYGTWVA